MCIFYQGSGRVTDLLARYLNQTATLVSQTQNEEQQVQQEKWDLPVDIKETTK